MTTTLARELGPTQADWDRASRAQPTYWGACVELCGRWWWLCHDEDGYVCLYPEDEDGAPGIRMACDSREELEGYVAEAGLTGAVKVVQYQ
ncbi:MAG: hypothetical protein K2R98_16800 [Gemmataceae bacterium]|nr:hypothetical protein [Gemmataceae bacterium]